MKTQKQAFSNILNHFTDDSYLKNKKQPYSSFHIFNLLVENYRPFLTKDDLLLMFYNINLYERCLGLYRNKEANSGQALFELIECSTRDYHHSLNAGMNSLYFAMAAYRDSMNTDYKAALLNLNLAINYSEEQGLSFPFFLTTIGEQWLNIVRIHIKTNNNELLVEESLSLLTFALTGQYGKDGVGERFINLGSLMHKQMIHHIVNSIDSGLTKYLSDDIFKQYFYRKLSAHLSKFEISLDPGIVTCFEILDLFYTNQERFLEEFDTNFENIMDAPSALQRVLFNALLLKHNNLFLESSEHPNFKCFQNNLQQAFAIKKLAFAA